MEATMLDTVRMLLLAAVGAIDLTDDKIRTILDDLVRRGDLAIDEARELTARWSRRASDRRDDLDDRIRAAVEDALGRYNVASHTSVLELQRHVAALEQVVGRLTTAPSPEP
jgi:polyhydroxyalkanoate synthesis regulator phasin